MAALSNTCTRKLILSTVQALGVVPSISDGGRVTANCQVFNSSVKEAVGGTYSLDVSMDQFTIGRSLASRALLLAQGGYVYNVWVYYQSASAPNIGAFFNVVPLQYPLQEFAINTATINTYPLWYGGITGAGRQGAHMTAAGSTLQIVPDGGEAPTAITIWIEATWLAYNPSSDTVVPVTAMLTHWPVPVDPTLGDVPITVDMPTWLNNPGWWQTIYSISCLDPSSIFTKCQPYNPALFETWNQLAPPPFVAIQTISYDFQPFLLSDADSGIPPTFSLQILLQQLDRVYINNQFGDPILWFYKVTLPFGNQDGITIPNFYASQANNTIGSSSTAQDLTLTFQDQFGDINRTLLSGFDIIIQLTVIATSR